MIPLKIVPRQITVSDNYFQIYDFCEPVWVPKITILCHVILEKLKKIEVIHEHCTFNAIKL